MNSTDFEKIRLPLNFNLDNVYATGYAIKIENTETDTAIIKKTVFLHTGQKIRYYFI